jgi:hypothetical protein
VAVRWRDIYAQAQCDSGRPQRSVDVTPDSRTPPLLGPSATPSQLWLIISPSYYQQDHLILNMVRHIMTTKKRVVVLNGAALEVCVTGESHSPRATLTCLAVPDFLSMKNDVFDIPACNTEASTCYFLAIVKELWQLCSSATTSPFPRCIDSLAQQGRLVRQYSQNVNWIEDQRSSLSTDWKAQSQSSQRDSQGCRPKERGPRRFVSTADATICAVTNVVRTSPQLRSFCKAQPFHCVGRASTPTNAASLRQANAERRPPAH